MLLGPMELAHLAVNPLGRQSKASRLEIHADHMRPWSADAPIRAEAHGAHLPEIKLIELLARRDELFPRHFAPYFLERFDEKLGGAERGESRGQIPLRKMCAPGKPMELRAALGRLISGQDGKGEKNAFGEALGRLVNLLSH